MSSGSAAPFLFFLLPACQQIFSPYDGGMTIMENDKGIYGDGDTFLAAQRRAPTHPTHPLFRKIQTRCLICKYWHTQPLPNWQSGTEQKSSCYAKNREAGSAQRAESPDAGSTTPQIDRPIYTPRWIDPLRLGGAPRRPSANCCSNCIAPRRRSAA